MGFEVLVPPASAGGGATDWGSITGKPPVQTVIGDPGSDSNFVTEQAVRELVDKTETSGFAFTITGPEAREYPITDDWPILPACTITRITTRAQDTTPNTTATAAFKINGTNITNASAVAVTETELGTVPSGANVLAQGNALSVALSDIVGTGEIYVTIWYTRAH